MPLNHFESLKIDFVAFMNFFKSRYPVIHNSNIFIRDLQYAIFHYFELKGIKLRFKHCEQLSNEFIKLCEEKDVFRKINKIGWKLNYPDFITGAAHKFEIENKTV
jgi:hypothetical protein